MVGILKAVVGSGVLSITIAMGPPAILSGPSLLIFELSFYNSYLLIIQSLDIQQITYCGFALAEDLLSSERASFSNLLFKNPWVLPNQKFCVSSTETLGCAGRINWR